MWVVEIGFPADFGAVDSPRLYATAGEATSSVTRPNDHHPPPPEDRPENAVGGGGAHDAQRLRIERAECA